MGTFEQIVYAFSGVVFGFVFILFLGKLVNKLLHGAKSTPKAKVDKKLDINKVKILQYNAFWRPNIAHIGRKEYAKDRAKELLARIDEYDIVCLNEAFAHIGGPVPDFLKKARAKGFVYISRSPPVDIFSNYVIDGGVIVLSKLPILKSDYYTFQLGSNVDMFCQKGCTYAKIELARNRHFHLFATHLQATYKGSEQESRTVRNCQLREIRSFIQRTAIDSYPIILAGDLNINALDEATQSGKTNSEYNRMFTNLQLESFTLTDCLDTNGHLPTFGDDEKVFTTSNYDRDSKQCIDYFLTFNYPESYLPIDSYDVEVLKMETQGKHPYTHLSDHYALSGTFEFLPTNPTNV